MTIRWIVAGTLTLGVATNLLANHWPQWRGPNGNGVVDAGQYPTAFSPSEHVLWKTPLPGAGSSTPVVWGNQLFLTAGVHEDQKADEDAPKNDAVLCYDRQGKEQWRILLGEERKGKHRNGSGSNPSPVTDGQHVFAYYKSGTVAALDMSGKLLWKQNLQTLYGKDTLWWDLGTSPVLAGGNLVIAVMHAGESYLVAFEKGAGKVAWKTARQFDCKEESDQSYATPIVIKSGDAEHIVTWGADHLTAHDAAGGALLWTCGGFNPNNEAMWRQIASPAVSEGIAVVPYGRAKYLAAVKLGGEGDITKTNRLWEKEGLGSDVPTPVAKDGKVYLLSDNGKVFCFDLKTGQELWEDRLPRSSSKYYASPILAGDVLYCAREDGLVNVGKVSAKGFELMASNDMGERIIATPVLIDDQVIIRGSEHLFCIGKP